MRRAAQLPAEAAGSEHRPWPRARRRRRAPTRARSSRRARRPPERSSARGTEDDGRVHATTSRAGGAAISSLSTREPGGSIMARASPSPKRREPEHGGSDLADDSGGEQREPRRAPAGRAQRGRGPELDPTGPRQPRSAASSRRARGGSSRPPRAEEHPGPDELEASALIRIEHERRTPRRRRSVRVPLVGSPAGGAPAGTGTAGTRHRAAGRREPPRRMLCRPLRLELLGLESAQPAAGSSAPHGMPPDRTRRAAKPRGGGRGEPRRGERADARSAGERGTWST